MAVSLKARPCTTTKCILTELGFVLTHDVFNISISPSLSSISSFWNTNSLLWSSCYLCCSVAYKLTLCSTYKTCNIFWHISRILTQNCLPFCSVRWIISSSVVAFICLAYMSLKIYWSLITQFFTCFTGIRISSRFPMLLSFSVLLIHFTYIYFMNLNL